MALVLFDASICANNHIICGWLLILLMGTSDPLMPANLLGMGLGQILDLGFIRKDNLYSRSWVWDGKTQRV
jgi:hypothetical protein